MIHIAGLSKTYGTVQALADLRLDIPEGSVFGFIGPNGAGKSTTMLILATLLISSSGKAEIDGYDVQKQGAEVRKIIGYMPDFFGVYDGFTALEYLDFYASCYGIKRVERRKMVLELLELVNLGDKKDQPVDGLSRGMKQRLGLARSLVHDPKVLILDEPASGLDPRARIEFREVLKELRNMGKTIMISSHILPELADLCNTVGVMEKGKLVASGPVDQLLKKAPEDRLLEIRFLDHKEETENILQSMNEVLSVEKEEDKWLVKLAGDEQIQAELLTRLLAEKLQVVHFAEVEVNIEDVFLQVTQQPKGEVVDEKSAH